MKYSSLLFFSVISFELIGQIYQTTLLEYDFNGWFPEELTVAYSGPAEFDSAMYVWRPITVLNYTSVFGPNGCSLNGNGFITAGNFQLPPDWQDEWGVYHSYITFPESSTLGFDSLVLSFDLMFFEVGTAMFSVEFSNNGGQNWYTALQQAGTFGNINGCEAHYVELNVSDFASENTKVRLHHEGWRFTALDNFHLRGFSNLNQSFGCMNPIACNFDSSATIEDGTCLFLGYSCDDGISSTVNDLIQTNCQCSGEALFGCTQIDACNFVDIATADDGSCLFENAPCDDANSLTINDVIQNDCECEGDLIQGCTYSNSCNYNFEATLDDGSCIFIGDECDDNNPATEGDLIEADCNCIGFSTSTAVLLDSYSPMLYPNPAKESVFFELEEFSGQRIEFYLYDAMGQLIMTQIDFLPFKLDVSELRKGFYFVNMQIDSSMLLNSSLIID